MPNTFALDIDKIRADARAMMVDGAVTADNTADVGNVIDVLNQVVDTEFAEYATEERQLLEAAAERISQLGGIPDVSPAGQSKSHTDYVITDETDLRRMLEENLVAERIVISHDQEIVRWLGDSDPTTRRLLESILDEEEEHADDLNDLLGN